MQHFSKKDWSILIGNGFDHFNSSLYNFIAPILAPLFFPNHKPIIQLIMAYSIFGTSLLSKPIGAYLFGIIAKNKGPTYSLSYSLIGTAMASILIGMLPSYNQISCLAPLGLILIKFIGGIFASGESAVAKLYILEGKESNQAYKASYIYHASSMIGIILASTAAVMALNYGNNSWRLCYVVGGATGFIGYYLRYNDFKKVLSYDSARFNNEFSLKILWQKKVIVLRVALVTGFSYITYAVPFVIMNNYVPLITNISLNQMMQCNTMFLVIDLFLIPIIGQLTINYKPRNIMLYSSLCLAIITIPLWNNIIGASFTYITFIRFIVVIIGVTFACPMNLWLKSLIKSSDQYLVTSMGGAMGSATIGRLSPAICLSLWHYTESSISIALYVLAITVGAFLAVYRKEND